MFEALSIKYGWTYAEIGQMTLYAAAIAFGAKSPEHGRFRMTQQQFANWRMRREMRA